MTRIDDVINTSSSVNNELIFLDFIMSVDGNYSRSKANCVLQRVADYWAHSTLVNLDELLQNLKCLG